MKYNGIYIKEDDMWSSYQKIGNKIKSKRFNPKETSIFIQFSKITCEIPELNSNVKNNGIDSYYSDLKLSLLDKHWNLESEWYFSFARRLIEKHNGISQFDECIKCLISDKFSRRCVLSTYVYNIDNE